MTDELTAEERTLVALREAIREAAETIQQWEDGLITSRHALNIAAQKLMAVLAD